MPARFHLYAMLRAEQAAAARSAPQGEPETAAILRFAQAAFGDLRGLLIARDDRLLEDARDAEWTLRDLLRHVLAVELRYREQVRWSVDRGDDDPLEIPAARLPGDRLAPAGPEFAASATGGFAELVALIAFARARTDAALAGVAASALERPSLWGTARLDVRLRMHQLAAHIVEHTIQAERMFGRDDGEARRALRRVSHARGWHERTASPAALAALDAEHAQRAATISR